MKPTDIEMPCDDYPIKVIGDTDDAFTDRVCERLAQLDVRFDRDQSSMADSRNGRFVSLTVLIRAESEDQLSHVNAELRKLPFVRMVL